ncbi:MAG: hypothetical protein ACKVZJ_04505 [Phycisphaerales bacterium]
MLPTPPKPVLVLLMLASLAAMALASACAVLAVIEVFRTPKINQLYFLASFACVAIVAGLFGMLTSMNRFRSGPALAMLCVSGPLLAGAMLGEPALSARLLGQPVEPMVLSGVPIKYLALGQLVCGVVVMLCIPLTVFTRNPRRCWGYVGRSILSTVPMVASVALFQYFPVIFPSVPGAVRWGIGAIVFFVVVAFFSISMHCLIRAFESGRLSEMNDAAGSSEHKDGAVPAKA